MFWRASLTPKHLSRFTCTIFSHHRSHNGHRKPLRKHWYMIMSSLCTAENLCLVWSNHSLCKWLQIWPRTQSCLCISLQRTQTLKTRCSGTREKQWGNEKMETGPTWKGGGTRCLARCLLLNPGVVSVTTLGDVAVQRWWEELDAWVKGLCLMRTKFLPSRAPWCCWKRWLHPFQTTTL